MSINNSKSHAVKTILFCSLGNMMEIYDFTLYGILISVISKNFFPNDNQNLSILIGMLSFSITFLFAPIGSIFWGWYGDKYGRLKMLKLSMYVMAIPSFLIAILPTYDQAGIIAPIFLIILRIIQGISSSGEIKGSKIYAMEELGESKFGRVAGYIVSAGCVGVTLGMFMGYIISHFDPLSNVWRIPFLLGSTLALIAAVLRNRMNNKQEQNIPQIKITELLTVLKQNKHQSIQIFILGGVFGVVAYIINAFMTPYLFSLGFDQKFNYAMSLVGIITTGVFSLIAGYQVDKHYNVEKIMVAKLKFIPVTILLSFIFINYLPQNFIFIAMIMLGIIYGSYATVVTVVMYKSFPQESRCRCVLFLYSLSMSIFGGLTPITMKMISQINPILPGILGSAVCYILYVIYNKTKRSI